MKITVENPLGRVPVSMILDDSCPVVNLNHFWIKLRRQSGRAGGTEFNPDEMPVEIPESFARKFGEWCADNGVKGKFSFVPMPGGLGTIDLGLPGFSKAHLDSWIKMTKEVIWPHWDLTPEMITHCKRVDLRDWTMSDEWEQSEWADQPKTVEDLAPYIAAALQILHNIDIPAEGVTSPGAFAHKVLDNYGEANLQAQKRVNNNPRPFFFCEVDTKGLPYPKIYSLNKEKGECCAGVIAGTGDWFAGWEGRNRKAIGHPDQCITEDLQGGRMPELIRAGCPAIMVSHWPGFYFEGEEVGFNIFKTVVQRLNQIPNILWMKTSEIAEQWIARAMVDITETADGGTVKSAAGCKRFTLRLAGAKPGQWKVNGAPLREVSRLLDLQPGTWAKEGEDVVLAFDLGAGETKVARG
jgi:hypothetical protein